ncbi:hypothetical protein YC2023_007692 [Brassica napus]
MAFHAAKELIKVLLKQNFDLSVKHQTSAKIPYKRFQIPIMVTRRRLCRVGLP